MYGTNDVIARESYVSQIHSRLKLCGCALISPATLRNTPASCASIIHLIITMYSVQPGKLGLCNRMHKMQISTHFPALTGRTAPQRFCVRISSLAKPNSDTTAESKRRSTTSRSQQQKRASIGVQSSASTKEAATQPRLIDSTHSYDSNSVSSLRAPAESLADPAHAYTAIDSSTAGASVPQGSIPAVVALITGCSVGAGTLALPAATTSAGFGPSAGV